MEIKILKTKIFQNLKLERFMAVIKLYESIRRAHQSFKFQILKLFFLFKFKFVF